MSAQSEQAILFLAAGLGIVVVLLASLGLVFYAWQRSRKRQLHFNKVLPGAPVLIQSKKYNQTEINDYIPFPVQSPPPSSTKPDVELGSSDTETKSTNTPGVSSPASLKEEKEVEEEHKTEIADEKIDIQNEIVDDDSIRLIEEFNSLTKQFVAHKSTSVASLPQNLRRNRHFDCVPFDENRVMLKGEENDYINASHIVFDDTKKAFIGAQNPMGPTETSGGRRESTVVDFWKMIWEEHVEVIIMLGPCTEIFREVGTRYWPENADETVSIDSQMSMTLYCYTEDECSFKREIWLEKQGCGTRRIIQWHCKDWPISTSTLLDFAESVRSSLPTFPIVVHCPSGIGRTAVFIAVYKLLEQLHSGNRVDIYQSCVILNRLRRNMIQTIDQYRMIYETIAMAIERKKSH